jgi:hypothetical protein
MASKDSLGSQAKPIPLTAHFLLQKALPPLHYLANYHTTSKAVHDIHFTGPLEPWDSFEKDVLDFCSTIKEKYELENILGYASSKPLPHDMSVEHFRCGEEISVSGRFVSNALHVASCIGRNVGLETIFGDWKAVAKASGEASEKKNNPKPESKKSTKGKEKEAEEQNTEEADREEIKKGALIPDFALMDFKSCKARAVGEAKTPWVHPLLQQWHDHGVKNTLKLRHALGRKPVINIAWNNTC